jgi:UDP-N-acetylglucosamine transferase subunit ALG13
VIFATVGTHTVGFDRLVSSVDNWASTGSEHVVIQIGNSKYVPRYAEWFRFELPTRIESLMAEARIVVTHGGAGSLLAAVERGGATVAIPRLAVLGEAIDDHQAELCLALRQAGLIQVVRELTELPDALRAGVQPAESYSLSPRAQLVDAVATAVDALSATHKR